MSSSFIHPQCTLLYSIDLKKTEDNVQVQRQHQRQYVTSPKTNWQCQLTADSSEPLICMYRLMDVCVSCLRSKYHERISRKLSGKGLEVVYVRICVVLCACVFLRRKCKCKILISSSFKHVCEMC